MTKMILVDQAVLEQALEALEYHVEQTRPIWKTSAAIAALEAALAQQTQVQQAQALNDWARDKLARYGIDMPDDPKA